MANKHPSAQGYQVNYEFHTLGWKAFQDLCATVVSETLGQTIQVFLPVNDGGRDGAFHGSWNPTGRDEMGGSFTVQCKFTSRANASLRLSSLTDELEKASCLASKGLADYYLLMTNFGVSAASEDVIRRAFLKQRRIKRFLLFGADWITLRIRESPRLRMLIPRVYGLGDLSQILDERAYVQAEEILASMREDLAKFVMTEAYKKSAKAVISDGFVLLLGEPASGKSTIAASLALGAVDLWGCSTMKIQSPEEFQRLWNPHEPRQFFWVDDAFGTTQYQRELAITWNRVFPGLNAAIRRGTRVLFTSRDYIYRAALADLKTSAFPFLNESQVIIDVQALSRDEKEQILYNHIKLGNQNTSFRKGIKRFLPEVASATHFLPEIARRLGNGLFTKNLPLTHQAVVDFVQKPLSFLIDTVRSLDKESRAALILLFAAGGSLESPVAFDEANNEVLRLLGATQAGVINALVAMNESLVRFVHVERTTRWVFRHPTIRDAITSTIADNPELLDIYLRGTQLHQITQEVICGDVGLEGARVVIPVSRYDAFIARLGEPKESRYPHYFFLSSRCDETFLAKFVETYPSIFDVLPSLTSYLGADANVAFLARLHEFGLLPADQRVIFVNRVEELALETPDVDFLSSKTVRSLLTEAEISRILHMVRSMLLPELEDIVDVWDDGYSPDEEPEDYFYGLKDALEQLEAEFLDDEEATDLILSAQRSLENYISDHESERFDDDEEPGDVGNPISRNSASGDRSIFEDVDE